MGTCARRRASGTPSVGPARAVPPRWRLRPRWGRPRRRSARLPRRPPPCPRRLKPRLGQGPAGFALALGASAGATIGRGRRVASRGTCALRTASGIPSVCPTLCCLKLRGLRGRCGTRSASIATCVTCAREHAWAHKGCDDVARVVVQRGEGGRTKSLSVFVARPMSRIRARHPGYRARCF